MYIRTYSLSHILDARLWLRRRSSVVGLVAALPIPGAAKLLTLVRVLVIRVLVVVTVRVLLVGVVVRAVISLFRVPRASRGGAVVMVLGVIRGKTLLLLVGKRNIVSIWMVVLPLLRMGVLIMAEGVVLVLLELHWVMPAFISKEWPGG